MKAESFPYPDGTRGYRLQKFVKDELAASSNAICRIQWFKSPDFPLGGRWQAYTEDEVEAAPKAPAAAGKEPPAKPA